MFVASAWTGLSPAYSSLSLRFLWAARGVPLPLLLSADVSLTAAPEIDASLGAKGVIELELVSSGERWGRGPRQDLHSSNEARVDSPAWHLVQALNTLVKADITLKVDAGDYTLVGRDAGKDGSSHLLAISCAVEA